MKKYERKKYQLHARLPAFRRRVEQAIQSIRKANKTTSPWVVSYSGGKDSVVLLDLVAIYGLVDHMLYFYYEETPKENGVMAGQAAKKYGLQLHTLKVPGALDVYEKVGHFFIEPRTAEEKKWTNWMLREYKRVANRYVEGQGWNGQYLGLRKKESRARMFALSKKGDLYQTKDRKGWTCVPLHNWSGDDIWAYIVSRELPYLSVYDSAMQERERIRSEPTFLATEAIWRYGHGAFIQKHHPDIWAKVQKWPEVRRYL